MGADGKFPIRGLLFCFVIVAICYANSIANDFILDDSLIVAANPDIRTIQPLQTFKTPFWGEKSGEGIYRPLVILGYSIEYSLWHRWAPGFRLTNLVLHAINGYLVFLLVRSFLWASPAAWAASAIYLAHPAHTEAVAGIAGRSDLLSATFLFLGGILAVSAVLCISHNYVWKDNYTFYKNMVRVFPNNIRGRQGFGVALLDGGFASEAGVQFESGLTVARNAPLLLGLAGVQMKLDHNCDRARESIDEALRIQPNNSSVHWLLAECFENEGDLASASDTYRRAVEETQFPDARLLFDWGMLMENMGKHQEAVALYQRAALIDPNDLSIKFKLKSQGREW